MKQYSCNIIVKDTWIMPKANEETTLTLQEPSDLLVGCWLWNPSVGYLEVTKYSGYDIYVTVKNLKMEENAREGTIFPSCMEMLVIAPNATPILDNNVTCLSADFISPEEGSTALMKVVDSSAIKAADLIIVDNKYQYVVIQVIDEHTLEVLNEGKGAEGIIKIDCTGCVSVKIFESTYCCKVLQEEVDDIYTTLNDRHSIKAWTGNNLVTISGGNDSLIAPYDVTVKVDNDLSNYDNSITKFSSLLYFKESANYSTANFYPDRSTGMGYYQLGTIQNYYDNAYIRTITGPSNTQYLYMSGVATTLSGTSYVHLNVNGGGFITLSGTSMSPAYNISSGTISLGTSSKSWSNVYTDKITLNGTTYTSIPSPANDGKLTIYNSDGVTPFIEFTADQSGNTSATLPTIPTPATVNDAKLSIYKSSDAVNPVIEFTANAATNVTATLANVAFSGSYNDLSDKPTIPSALIYFEENKTGDHYSFRPKSLSDPLSINIGTSSNPFTDGYINTTHTTTIRSGSSNLELYPDSTSYSVKIFGERWWVRGSVTTTLQSLEPRSVTPGDTGLNLGSINYWWNTLYISTIKHESAYINFQTNNGVVEIRGMAPGNLNGNIVFSLSRDYIWMSQNSNFDFQVTPYISGKGNIGTNGAKFANVYTVNLNGAVSPSSDIKKKENIVERGTEKSSNKSLDKILTLKTYNYVLKEDITKQERIGIMAQELREVEPVLVVNKAEKDSKDEDLYYDLTGFVTLIMEAVQELAQDVADLKKALIKGDDNEYKEVSKEG